MTFKKNLLFIICPLIALAQTKVDNLKPEINNSLNLRILGEKTILSANIAQRFFTTDDSEYFTGLTGDAYTSSPLIYNRLSLMAIRTFNSHWYGMALLQTQLGRYHFYNFNRSFSTLGSSIGHRGKIDEINFYKEIGITTNNQKPRSIKDLYITVKFEYPIRSGSKPIALASLSGRIDWLGTSFKSVDNDLFVLRAKDESILKKVDQSHLTLNFDFLLTAQNTISLNTTYFTEYYPSADLGYDKRNIKHYIFGIVWAYHISKNAINLENKFFNP